MPSSNSETCSKPTKWGPCQQTNLNPETGLCSSHTRWWFFDQQPDPYYEEKIVKALVEPTWDWMTETEAEALLNGRYRGDGRRIDQWITADPLGVEL
jgi:hypothetical protein